MIHDAPVVTVVMPVFNGRDWVEETIRSVDAQRGVRVERIAVDDGSTDGSADLLRRAGWTVLTMNRVGPNVARARALRRATGTLVAFLDQDDLWHPDHLALAADALASYPLSPAAVGTRVAFSGRVRPRLGARRRGPATFDPWAIYPVNIIDTPSMAIVRRTALEVVGGWPADRPLGSDPLLWWRLSVDAPLAVLPRRTVGVRRSGQSLSVVSRGRPLDYLHYLRLAAAEAVAGHPGIDARRIAASGDRILSAVTGVVAALVEGDGLAAAAQDLEAALVDGPDAMVTATVGFCGWMLAPQLRQPPADGIDPVAAIIENWPASAVRTRAAALRMVAAVAGPWRTSTPGAGRLPTFRRLAVAGTACMFAAAGCCGRVADPFDLPLECRTGVRSP